MALIVIGWRRQERQKRVAPRYPVLHDPNAPVGTERRKIPPTDRCSMNWQDAGTGDDRQLADSCDISLLLLKMERHRELLSEVERGSFAFIICPSP